MMPISTVGNSTRQAGFTLIELAVVVLLISLFTLISIPLFSYTGRGNVQTSARHLSGTVKYLFNEAALSGLEHRLIYNLDRNTYRAMILETDGSLEEVGGPGKETALRNGVRFSGVTLTDRGSFTSGEVTIRFHPTGWVEETIVHLAGDRQEDALTLHVNPLTGSTEIFAGNREFLQN